MKALTKPTTVTTMIKRIPAYGLRGHRYQNCTSQANTCRILSIRSKVASPTLDSVQLFYFGVDFLCAIPPSPNPGRPRFRGGGREQYTSSCLLKSLSQGRRDRRSKGTRHQQRRPMVASIFQGYFSACLGEWSLHIGESYTKFYTWKYPKTISATKGLHIEFMI